MRVVSRWSGLTILKQVVWVAGVLSSGSVVHPGLALGAKAPHVMAGDGC